MSAQLVLGHKHGGDCILCMSRPVDEITGRVEPMFTAVGVDVNYGDNANVCVVCAGVMADLLERPTASEHQNARERYLRLRQQHEDLQQAFTKQAELIDRIKQGAKAQKEVRAG